MNVPLDTNQLFLFSSVSAQITPLRKTLPSYLCHLVALQFSTFVIILINMDSHPLLSGFLHVKRSS